MDLGRSSLGSGDRNSVVRHIVHGQPPLQTTVDQSLMDLVQRRSTGQEWALEPLSAVGP